VQPHNHLPADGRNIFLRLREAEDPEAYPLCQSVQLIMREIYAVFYFDGTAFSYFDQCSMISCAMGAPTR
jgi:hypothetical protein